MGRSGKINTRLPALFRQHATHADMLAAERFGIDDQDGAFAIFVNADEQKSGDDYEVAQQHALQLADREAAIRGTGRVLLLENPSTEAVIKVIANPEVSSLAFIGHGKLGAFRSWNQGSEQLGWLSWHHLLPAMNHLKTGVVEQRTCASMGRTGQVVVPLGTFIVADQTKLTAPAPGSNIHNSVGFEGFNALLAPVFSAAHNSVAELMSQTGQDPTPLS